MYCNHCGAQLPDNATFCGKCGNRLEDQSASGQAAVLSPQPETQKKGKKPVSSGKGKGIFLILALVLGAVLLIGGGALLLKGGSKPAASKPIVIAARVDEDGVAYIPMMDGTVIEIDEEVRQASMTPDRKRIVVLLEDGTLYVTDPKLKDKRIVTEEASMIALAGDEHFFYLSEDEESAYLVNLTDFTSVELPTTADSMAPSWYVRSFLLADVDGDVYIVSPDSQEEQVIASVDGKPRAAGVSDDGQIAVWSDGEDGEYTIYLSENGEIFELGEVEEEPMITVQFSADQKMVLIAPYGESCMWLKQAGKEPVKMKYGSESYNPVYYSEKGYFNRTNAADIDAVYAAVQKDSLYNLYCFTLKGERERVLSGVKEIQIQGGTAYYRDEDDTLHCAELKGSTLKEDVEIAKNVDIYQVCENGKYVYYFKKMDSGEGTLYCHKIGQEESVKVASDVSANSYATFCFSADGKTLLFWKDVESVENSYNKQGTLMLWSYGDEAPTKISGDVCCGSVSSGLRLPQIDPDSFVFLKDPVQDSEGDLWGDWMYYDGKEATRFASEVRQ